jgi:5-methylcytosine-specific restriction endonuclease McrA
MTRVRQKRRRLRLDPAAYRELREQVLARDGWRCQFCGSLAGAEVHHIEPRSHLGDDREENLITLCSACHRKLHRGTLCDDRRDWQMPKLRKGV